MYLIEVDDAAFYTYICLAVLGTLSSNLEFVKLSSNFYLQVLGWRKGVILYLSTSAGGHDWRGSR